MVAKQRGTTKAERTRLDATLRDLGIIRSQKPVARGDDGPSRRPPSFAETCLFACKLAGSAVVGASVTVALWAAAIGDLLGLRARLLLETDAPASVHIAVRTLGDEMLLHLVNPESLWNKQAPEQREIAVSLAIPPGSAVTDVQFTLPGPASRIPQTPTRLPFSVNRDRVSFKVPLKAYTMVVVAMRP